MRPHPSLRLLVLEDRSVPATLYGLTATNSLLRFDSATPGAATTIPVTGLQGGSTESLQGIDFRPRTGQFYGIGVVPGATDTLRTYRIDVATGAATILGTSVTAVAGTFYGVDFNPTVDRIRIVNTSDENLRINPNNGVLAGDDTNLTAPGRLVDSIAYDRNFENGNLAPTRTTIYGIARSGSQLVTIGGINSIPSPNTGVVTNVGPLGVVPSAAFGIGFDISATGQAFASLTDIKTAVASLYTINLGTGAATFKGAIGTGTVGLRGLAIAPESVVAVGSDAGSSPRLRVFDGATKALKHDLVPFTAAFAGGVRVATGDVNLDGVPDVIAGAGPSGGPHIRVFDGATGQQVPGALGSFFAFDSALRGGVHVAAGDINADGFTDVIVGADAGGGPHVRAFSGVDGSAIASFFAYDSNLRSGVRVASADFDLDGRWEIITAAGVGGGPHVRVLDSTGANFATASLPGFVSNFFAYDSAFRGGVTVAAGDFNGDGTPDIITGTGPGGGPHVRAFSGANNSQVASFFAYDSSFRGGVRVAAADFNADGRFELVAGPGRGLAAIVASNAAGTGIGTLTPFEANFLGGVFVAGSRR